MPIPLKFKAALDDSAFMAGIRRIKTAGSKLGRGFGGGGAAGGRGRMGGGVGGPGSLIAMGAVTAGIAKVTNEADALYNLSRKTGIATTSLAALAEMSKTANIETDQLASSVSKMQRNLAEDTPATAKALKTLGLSLKDLDTMRPEDQLLAIGSAIGAMEDGAQKAGVAMALFGRGGTDLFEFFDTIGTLDMTKISANAKRMGESAKTLAEARDVIDKFMFGVNARAAANLADLIKAGGNKGDVKGLLSALLGRTKDPQDATEEDMLPPVRSTGGFGALDVGRKEIGLTKGRGLKGASGLGIYGTEAGTGSGGQAYGYIKRGDAKIAKQADLNLKALQYMQEAAERLTTIEETLRGWDQ